MKKYLIIMSGLPGSGKSTLAEHLAKALSLCILSIDPIEAAMWRSGLPENATGIAAYEIARTLAQEQLAIGHGVMVDAVNPVEAARMMWRTLAKQQKAELIILECVYKNPELHKARIEQRKRNISGMPETTWAQVEHRRKEYEPWQDERLEIDSGQDFDKNLASALSYIKKKWGE